MLCRVVLLLQRQIGALGAMREDKKKQAEEMRYPSLSARTLKENSSDEILLLRSQPQQVHRAAVSVDA